MANVSWTDNNGNWSTAANWSSNPNLPGPSDNVAIDNANLITVTADIPVAINSLTLGSNVNDVTLDDHSFALTVASTVNIMDGSQLTGSGTVTGNLSGGGLVRASGGTLDLTGTVSPGLHFAIDSMSDSTLKFDGTATTSGTIAISNAHQTLEIGATGALTLGGAEALTNGTIRLDGGVLTDNFGLFIGSGATLIGSGAVNGSLSTGQGGSGTVEALGGTLDLTGAVSGPVCVIGATVPSDLKFDAVSSSAAIAINNANQTLEVGPTGALTLTGAESISNGTIRVDAGGSLIDNSGLTIGSGATLRTAGPITGPITVSGGHIVVDPGGSFGGPVEGGGSTLELAQGAQSGTLSGLGTTFVHFGEVKVDGGATWELSSGKPKVFRFINDGTITVGKHQRLVLGAVGEDTGEHGLFQLGGNAAADFARSASKSQTFDFTRATGTLELARPAAFAAQILHFRGSDRIDLVHRFANGLDYSGGRLHVFDGGTEIASLKVKGNYTTGSFALSDDGKGGTNITLDPPQTTMFGSSPAQAQMLPDHNAGMSDFWTMKG